MNQKLEKKAKKEIIHSVAAGTGVKLSIFFNNISTNLLQDIVYTAKISRNRKNIG